jgi:hypothetical protein
VRRAGRLLSGAQRTLPATRSCSRWSSAVARWVIAAVCCSIWVCAARGRLSDLLLGAATSSLSSLAWSCATSRSSCRACTAERRSRRPGRPPRRHRCLSGAPAAGSPTAATSAGAREAARRRLAGSCIVCVGCCAAASALGSPSWSASSSSPDSRSAAAPYVRAGPPGVPADPDCASWCEWFDEPERASPSRLVHCLPTVGGAPAIPSAGDRRPMRTTPPRARGRPLVGSSHWSPRATRAGTVVVEDLTRARCRSAR